ncbi:hypothetical protein CFAM422_006624 [Trichoderma lentiforme]|uniref:Uncharacterized protein n=1 Tax=Trichoderma lentiforme TaxID=1567552 RepID=A0A9P5CE07_9HYPO|nr:hypothetical protein CFAM422_006624 [Trichoderma lentiforme]
MRKFDASHMHMADPFLRIAPDACSWIRDSPFDLVPVFVQSMSSSCLIFVLARPAAPAPRRPAVSRMLSHIPSTCAPRKLTMRYKTTRFQWVCVTLMFWGFLLFLAWSFQAFFDYKVRLRAATGVYPAPAPAPAATTNVAITDGGSAGRLLARFSSSVRGLLAQNAAPLLPPILPWCPLGR